MKRREKITMDKNVDVRTPPGFGDTKPWILREVAWKEGSRYGGETRDYSAMIPGGMQVAEQFHQAYWDARTQAEMAMTACRTMSIKGPSQYVLVDINGHLRGWGSFNVSDGPDEIAWLSCWFLELRGWKCAFVVPKEVKIPEASRVCLADSEASAESA
jgi:hypothetical protein